MLAKTKGAIKKEWTTHRNWQYWVHKTEHEYKENKYSASLFII
jgi:hypothetical protein